MAGDPRAMTSPEPTAPRNPAVLVLVPMAIVLAVIGSCAAYFLWPRGQRVGSVDLLASEPSLRVELKPGDRLSFRLDVTVGTKSGYPDSSRGRSNAVHDQLETSIITVTLAQDGEPATTTKCGAYDGKATTVSSNSDDVESSGLPLTCSLIASKAGKHTLTTRVAWVPADLIKARLEVRRQRPDE
jgi:hypothetical protein